MKISSNASLSPLFRLISFNFFINLGIKDEKISEQIIVPIENWKIFDWEMKVNSEIGKTMETTNKKFDFLLEDF